MAFSFVYVLLLYAGVFAENHDREIDDVRPRISEGEPTTIDYYPWLVQVDFFFEKTNHWDQECAANIITPVFVLSVGHCFSGPGYQTSHRRIRAGATHRNLGGVIVYVQHEFVHPDFGKLGFDSDLAVIHLAAPLLFGPTISPVNIVSQGIVTPDDVGVWAAGWGTPSESGLPSDVLLQIRVFTINNDVCAERDLAFEEPVVVTKNMICAGLLDIGGEDVCYGDSGSGLLHDNILIGIVSWGNGCANPFFPGVYTSVAYYTNWILSIVNNNFIAF